MCPGRIESTGTHCYIKTGMMRSSETSVFYKHCTASIIICSSLFETKMPNLLLFVPCDGTLNILRFRITGQLKRTILTFLCWTFFSDFIDQRVHQLIKKISDIGTVLSVQMIVCLLLLIPTVPSRVCGNHNTRHVLKTYRKKRLGAYSPLLLRQMSDCSFFSHPENFHTFSHHHHWPYWRLNRRSKDQILGRSVAYSWLIGKWVSASHTLKRWLTQQHVLTAGTE